MEKLGFEESDHLNGYSIYPDAAIDTELAKVYVERFTTPNTGDVIPNDHTGLSENGAYGPKNQTERIAFASDFWDSLSNGNDVQTITVRSEEALRNYIGNPIFEPYQSNHIYFDPPLFVGGPINFNDQDDVDLGQAGNTGICQIDGNQHMCIYAYDDNIGINAKILGVDYDSRKKRTLWHEIGHILGLDDNSNPPTTGIMDQINCGSQAGINASRNLILNMHWTNTEATDVRAYYISNIE